MATSAKEFLKKNLFLSNSFIDQLFEMYSEENTNADLCIDLDRVSDWLDVEKRGLVRQLGRPEYRKGVDYVSKPAPDPNKTVARANNYNRVTITPETFKRLCLMSRTPNGERMRMYMIAVESLLIRYRNGIIKELRERVSELENNQRPLSARIGDTPRAGFIYIFRASPTVANLRKLGKARVLSRRMGQHISSQADNIPIEFQQEVADVDAVESCAKAMLKSYAYRGSKEVYAADLDTMKRFVYGCMMVKEGKGDWTALAAEEAKRAARGGAGRGGSPAAQDFILRIDRKAESRGGK